jgi:membrane protease YdiL (CAAX protease family)
MRAASGFIELAALGINSPRSYVATLLRVVLFPIAFLGVAFGSLSIAAAAHWLSAAEHPAAAIACACAAVIVAGASLIRGVCRSHRRPWLSLVSVDLTLDWRRLAIGAVVQAALIGISVTFAHLAAGQPWPHGSGLPAMALLVIMLLIPFQAASEELLFRGYLTQALGRVLRYPAIVVAVVAIIFAVLHFNAYGPLTVPYLALMSVIFSVVSLSDGRLELAIGAHAANNWVAIGATDVLAAGGTAIELNWAALAVLIVNGIVFFAMTRVLVRRLAVT